MVRIRAYSFVLSLPFILGAAGIVVWCAIDRVAGVSGFAVGAGLFVAGYALQLLFSLCMACPRCDKSPYAIGPFRGPFAFAGKPFPDRVCRSCGFDLAAGNAG